jgi:hypothetical protein
VTPYCCTNCGFWQKRFATPTWCPVCEDYRHPLPPDGYEFRTPNDMATQAVTIDEPLPGLHRISTTPSIGIGSCGYLIENPQGNLHFDGCGWYDEATLDFMQSRGGVATLCASHSHVYGALWRVVERFQPETIFQAEALPFCQAFRISFPFDERWMMSERFELIRTAGHTPDHTVLYDHDERRLFCGDALKFTFPEPGQTVGTPNTISCHKAYDAHIPLTHDNVRRYLDVFRTLDFDAVVTPWEVVPTGGKAMTMALLEKQLAGKPFAEGLPL